MVTGEAICHAASSAALGTSPWIKNDLIVIPSELTNGTPEAPSALAMTIRPDKSPNTDNRTLAMDVIRTPLYSEK